MTSRKTARSIRFTGDEPAEIYYCLTDKLRRVTRGDYRCKISDDQTAAGYRQCVREEDQLQKRRVADLKRLIRKIGVDGKNLKKMLPFAIVI